jgi:tetratricopeptide (TPR) repeat protein
MLGLTGMLSMAVLLLAAANEPPEASKRSKDPMFVRWLVPEDPGDEVIRFYWERTKQDKASAKELVDLGTMLFHRGYPKDAVRMYKRALDKDKKLYEAWFRIGLVEHREGNLRTARRAYRKCLKELTGHGWCNFYLGLLEEQTGHPSKALNYYRRAFKFAPVLADPKVNPEILYSKLDLGALLRRGERNRFSETMPFTYLQPGRVKQLRAVYTEDVTEESPATEPAAEDEESKAVDQPPPTPTPIPSPPRPATASQTGSTPAARRPPDRPIRRIIRPTPVRRESTEEEEGSLVRLPPPGTGAPAPTPPPTPTPAPRVSDVSPEARVLPLWLSPLEETATRLARLKKRPPQHPVEG